MARKWIGRAAWKRKYQKYIASAKWKKRRLAVIEARGGRCEQCGGRERLQVHHKSYAHLFNERDSELQVLCRACHVAKHGGWKAILKG